MLSTNRRLLAAGLSMFLLLIELLAGRAGMSGPTVAFAEEPTQYSNVTLWVWPEYDDPRLLVMWEGNVAGQSGTTTTAKFLVPTGVELYFTGYQDNTGKFISVNPKEVPSGIKGYDLLTFDITGVTFRVEYYQDSIQGNPDKSINFEFKTLYPIKNLNIDVQQPLLATNYKIEPQLQTSTQIQNITSYQSTYDSLGPDKALSFTIKYTKTNPATSVLQGNAAGSNSTQAPNNSQALSSSTDNTWITFGVIGVLCAAFFLWLERRRRNALTWDDEDDEDDEDDDYYEDERPRRRRLSRELAAKHAGKEARGPVASQTLAKEGSRLKGRARMEFCPYCQAKLSGSSSRCVACGAELEV